MKKEKTEFETRWETLNDIEKEVINLRYHQKMSFRKIAKKLKIGISTSIRYRTAAWDKLMSGVEGNKAYAVEDDYAVERREQLINLFGHGFIKIASQDSEVSS